MLWGVPGWSSKGGQVSSYWDSPLPLLFLSPEIQLHECPF